MCVVHAHIVCDLGNSMMSKCMCSLYWHNWRWIIPFYGLYPCDLVLEGRKSLAKSRALIFHQSSCFSSITFFIISRILVETKQPLFVAILWSIWRVRNECIWENKQANLVTSCRLALDMIWDFNWCCNMLNTDLTPTHVLTWEKPSANWLKCNVDGAIFMIERKFGIAIWFRDSMGSFVQLHTMIFPFVNEPCSRARFVQWFWESYLRKWPSTSCKCFV
jgi:hypothetical protein